MSLKFWADGSVLTATFEICKKIFAKLITVLEKINAFDDAETCPSSILDLLAYQRGITRLASEDEELYRLRIKHAFANAKDAGSVAGFARIFERLKLGRVIQLERSDEVEWDYIKLEIDEAKFSKYRGLFEELIKLYGRTCRRYQIVSTPQANQLYVATNCYGCDYSYIKCVIEQGAI